MTLKSHVYATWLKFLLFEGNIALSEFGEYGHWNILCMYVISSYYEYIGGVGEWPLR